MRLRRRRFFTPAARRLAWVALCLSTVHFGGLFLLVQHLPTPGRVLRWNPPPADTAASFYDSYQMVVPQEKQELIHPLVVQLPLPNVEDRLFSTTIGTTLHDDGPPDFGGLHISIPSRKDYLLASALYEQERQQWLDQMDVPNILYYYNHYDDLDFSVPPLDAALDESNPATCERPTWGYISHPNCNVLHEMPPLDHPSFQFLGHGYFRDTWLLNSVGTEPPPVVIKHLRYEHDQDLRYQYEMTMEALILERTTASPVTGQIYGHCSTSLLVEAGQDVTHRIVPLHKNIQSDRGRISNEQWNQLQGNKTKPYRFNNLTDWETLNYAIQMAEGLAEMHGHAGGVLVHDDVHPDQWLLSRDGTRLILNDLNNAVIMSWSRAQQRYCPYWDRYDGDFRAPEVYRPEGSLVDESNDLWPMGNLIYSLITGLYPYHNTTAFKKIENITLLGTRPFLHATFYRAPNYILQRLMYIMKRCHMLDPAARPSIFQVLQFLVETRRNVLAHAPKQRTPKAEPRQ